MSPSYIHQGIIIIGIILIAQLPRVSPQVVLNGTIRDGAVMCPGDMIIFRCETTGSLVIAWASDQYIGIGSQLQFATFNNLNENRTSESSGTTATFISKEDIETSPVLVSELTIIVSPDFSNPSITCIHVSDGTRDSISFQLLGDPEMPQIKTFEQRMHPQKEGVCTLHFSWDLVEDVTHYMVYFNGNNVDNTSDTSYALLVYCASHNLSIQAVNRCNRMSLRTPNVIVIPQRFLYSEITSGFVTETDVTGSPESSTEGSSIQIALIVLLVCVPVILLGIIILLSALLILKKYNKDADSTCKNIELVDKSDMVPPLVKKLDEQ